MPRPKRSQHRNQGRRFARPQGQDRAAPVRGNMAPWFLKSFGSRPASKLKPAAQTVEEA